MLLRHFETPLNYAPGDTIVVELLASWRSAITDAVSRWRRILRDSVASRQALASCLRTSIAVAHCDSGPFLLLLFGSLGRGEPAHDVDILLVLPGESPELSYDRIMAGTTQCDLNVASRAWLEDAPLDPEWGYWLTEAYLAAGDSAVLESSWLSAANRYWSRDAMARRLSMRGHMLDDLLVSAEGALKEGRRAAACYLTHEAARIVASMVIEYSGRRTFSHRSLIGETFGGLSRLGVPPTATWGLIRALLGGVVAPRRRASRLYRALRAGLSRVCRKLPADTGYSPAQNQAARLRALRICLESRPSVLLETSQAGTTSLFSDSRFVEGSIRAMRHIERTIHRAGRLVVAHRTGRTLPAPPTRGTIRGARWVECERNRLKIILNTGGCKTPTCSFCALPEFGRSFPRRSPAETVREALGLYRPREVAIYNDGSLLNPAEVRPEDRVELWRTVRAAGVTGLAIETIPRFVQSKVIRELVAECAVEDVTVTMGLQCISDSIAVRTLGRPDVDAVFERAIEVITRAGANVRLYLLWRPPLPPNVSPQRLLATSIRWALQRRVKRITICPWIDPAGNPSASSSVDLCGLLEVLAAVAPALLNRHTRVDVSLPDVVSCAISPRRYCARCAASLRLGPSGWAAARAGVGVQWELPEVCGAKA